MENETAKSELSSGLTVTWVGVVINILLIVAKVWAGLIGKSQALLADGIHSFSDLFGDFVVLFGLKWGRKAEDEDHPFGHARIETISSMVVGILLLLVALGLAYNAFSAIYHHRESSPGFLTIIVAFVSIVLKEGMYRYTKVIGQRIGSPALIGNAWHHRTDALSSVAVLFGVGAAYLNPSWRLADSLAALVVTVFIVKVGASLVWTALREVVDTAPDRKVLDQLTGLASTVDGVRQVHDIRARYSGGRIFVEMHIVVNPDLTVRRGHDIARTVKYRLLGEIPDVTRVIIHVDPEMKGEA